MVLRLKIFFRTVTLLAALIIVSTVAIVSFVIYQNRLYWDERCRQEASFIAAQTERLVLWDDRTGIQDLLKNLVVSVEQLDYAFIERNGVPYAHTFRDGVPKGLLGRGRSTGGVERFEFKDSKGEVYFDYSMQDEFSGTTVHLGVSRYKVDRGASGVLGFILLSGSSLLLLSLVPGWLVSSAITREVNQVNEELKRVNRELEDRVERRTSELREANEALTAEMAERKKLEKQRDDFLSMLRHDMRTPLSVIYGYSDIVHNQYADRLDGDFSNMMKSIINSSQSLSRMVEGIAEISRLESGGIDLRKEQVDLGGLAVEVYMEFAAKAAARGLALRNALTDIPLITADEHYVKRAISNLVANALNYTPAGGTVTLSCGKRGNSSGDVFVQVSDTGPGIPAAEKDRVFEKYYRLPNATGTSGKGLGLAIVKAVMDAHGGRVELDSEPGAGSAFRLVFPL